MLILWQFFSPFLRIQFLFPFLEPPTSSALFTLFLLFSTTTCRPCLSVWQKTRLGSSPFSAQPRIFSSQGFLFFSFLLLLSTSSGSYNSPSFSISLALSQVSRPTSPFSLRCSFRCAAAPHHPGTQTVSNPSKGQTPRANSPT